MKRLNDEPTGATPLTPDDLSGLKFPHIQTRAQLNELEAANILEGQLWAGELGTLTLESLFCREFITELHKRLFGDVWEWAGKFRSRELNIGVDPAVISERLHNFLEDAKCWIEFQSFSHLELSARIQHGLVLIHPFVNGNGRHSRIFTDIMRVYVLQTSPLTWAKGDLENLTEERTSYISALRAADKHDFRPLMEYLIALGNPED